MFWRLVVAIPQTFDPLGTSPRSCSTVRRAPTRDADEGGVKLAFLGGPFSCSRRLARNLGPLLSCLVETDGDGLLATLHLAPRAALQRAFFSAPHGRFHILRRRLPVLRHRPSLSSRSLLHGGRHQRERPLLSGLPLHVKPLSLHLVVRHEEMFDLRHEVLTQIAQRLDGPVRRRVRGSRPRRARDGRAIAVALGVSRTFEPSATVAPAACSWAPPSRAN